MLLHEKYIDYSTFHAVWSAGDSSQYWSDFMGFNSVQVLWALETAFTVSGLTLTVPATLKTENLFTRSNDTSWNERTIQRGHLYFDEFQLYCLGTSSAISPFEPISGYTVRNASGDGGYFGMLGISAPNLVKKYNHRAEVDCFAFVSEILTSLKLTIKQTGSNTFYLLKPTSPYSIVDDKQFQYSEANQKAQVSEVGYSWATNNGSGNWSINSSNRSVFYSNVESQISEISTDEKAKVSMMLNFRMLFADTDTFSSEYNESVCEPNKSSDQIITDGTITAHLNPIAARYDNNANRHTEENILTDFQSEFYDIEDHGIEVRFQKSQLKQVV
jgi:hypothetical protein